MNTRLKAILTIVNDHRWFMLFVIAGLLMNLYLLLQHNNEKTDFITCSSYDKGPLGTYGLFRDLEDRGVPVRRIKLPLYREIDSTGDHRKTLVILSPLFNPNPWEWDMLLKWVAQGNRLITAGVLGPKRSGWIPDFTTSVKTSLEHSAPSYLLLPIDTVFPYDDTLPPQSPVHLAQLFGKAYTTGDTLTLRHFTTFGPDVLPFMTHGNKPVAIKKAVGRGEWLAFTPTNPFSNSALRDSVWYRFATRLFTGDGIYSVQPILFDEFHNGYRATRSFWQLLTYYEFNFGIIYLSAFILLYLFLTGIRIIPPVPERRFLHMDALPGLIALTGLLIRFGAWTKLLKRECAIIHSELTRKSSHPSGHFTLHYVNKHRLPPSVHSPEELAKVFSTIETTAAVTDKPETVRLFNILMFMRKEMRL